MIRPNIRIVKAVFFGVLYADDSNEALEMPPTELTSFEIVPRIISGEYRGLSPAYKVKKYECSICHEDLEKCIHKIGNEYGGSICRPIIKDAEILEISIVSKAYNPKCRILDLLVVNKEGHTTRYEWHGFPVDSEKSRFRNIQKALDMKLISPKAAFEFCKAYSIKLNGRVFYP